MIHAAETDGEGELDRLAAELLAAMEAEPVPPKIRDLALRLQAALAARVTDEVAEG